MTYMYMYMRHPLLQLCTCITFWYTPSIDWGRLAVVSLLVVLVASEAPPIFPEAILIGSENSPLVELLGPLSSESSMCGFLGGGNGDGELDCRDGLLPRANKSPEGRWPWEEKNIWVIVLDSIAKNQHLSVDQLHYPSSVRSSMVFCLLFWYFTESRNSKTEETTWHFTCFH